VYDIFDRRPEVIALRGILKVDIEMDLKGQFLKVLAASMCLLTERRRGLLWTRHP
jgi:hypothetical protein